MASAHRCWSSAMGRAVMRATTSTRTLTSSPGRRRLLHSMGDADADAQPAWRRTPTKQEVDILLDRLKETGTSSMKMETLDQTIDSVSSARWGVMSRRVQRTYASVGVIIIGFTLGILSTTPASEVLSK